MSVGSPTPSLDSLTDTPIGSYNDSDPTRSVETSPPVSNTSSVAGQSGVCTVCCACTETLVLPRLLSCFHPVCLSCAEKLFLNDRIVCPACQRITGKHPDSLLPDYALARLVEADESGLCGSCKSRERAACARCADCNQVLCSTCVVTHEYMNCYQGHRVSLLSDIALRDERPVPCTRHKEPIRYFCVSCQVPICKDCAMIDHVPPLHAHASILEASVGSQDHLSRYLEAADTKLGQLKSEVKNLDAQSTLFMKKYEKIQQEINISHSQVVNHLQSQKNELINEVDQYFKPRHLALAQHVNKVQENIENIQTLKEYLERHKKYASPIEQLMSTKLLEGSLSESLTRLVDPVPNLGTDIEFVSNYSSINQSTRNSLGYLKCGAEEPLTRKIAPIARPSTSVSSMNSINSCLNGISSLSLGSTLGLTSGQFSTQQLNALASQIGSLQQQNQQQQQQYATQASSQVAPLGSSSLASTLAALGSSSFSPSLSSTVLDRSSYNNQLSSLFAKRYNNLPNFATSNLHDLNLNSSGYEKWSSGGDGGVFSTDAIAALNATDSMVNDIKFSQFTTGFPPRSQIKRQKMIYHCKFGEFGVLEGQFTEPSGVAVNAQNDIIVADTNNHRIQIFDNEGRFKFQFGECGKRDGQLLYPNRVAVVQTSGDIIVTERSPTHQIQIYNQYGQFVRKFGANTLCYPRGVTVDNKGRIIVVECKVMRVIIFDQHGNVIHQFNCPSHLEFPNGVVVNDKQEIFISDNRAHCVKVFSYDGQYLRQIGGEGLTNYPIGVGITADGHILIADNHNNFNLTLFTQEGHLLSAYESKVKHAQCFDVALMDDGSVVLASKDYRLYVYRYLQVPPQHV